MSACYQAKTVFVLLGAFGFCNAQFGYHQDECVPMEKLPQPEPEPPMEVCMDTRYFSIMDPDIEQKVVDFYNNPVPGLPEITIKSDPNDMHKNGVAFRSEDGPDSAIADGIAVTEPRHVNRKIKKEKGIAITTRAGIRKRSPRAGTKKIGRKIINVGKRKFANEPSIDPKKNQSDGLERKSTAIVGRDRLGDIGKSLSRKAINKIFSALTSRKANVDLQHLKELLAKQLRKLSLNTRGITKDRNNQPSNDFQGTSQNGGQEDQKGVDNDQIKQLQLEIEELMDLVFRKQEELYMQELEGVKPAVSETTVMSAHAMPETAVPEPAVPESAVPEPSVPEPSVPETAVPAVGVLEPAVQEPLMQLPEVLQSAQPDINFTIDPNNEPKDYQQGTPLEGYIDTNPENQGINQNRAMSRNKEPENPNGVDNDPIEQLKLEIQQLTELVFQKQDQLQELGAQVPAVPETAGPETAQPEIAGPETAESETAGPETAIPEIAVPDDEMSAGAFQEPAVLEPAVQPLGEQPAEAQAQGMQQPETQELVQTPSMDFDSMGAPISLSSTSYSYYQPYRTPGIANGVRSTQDLTPAAFQRAGGDIDSILRNPLHFGRGVSTLEGFQRADATFDPRAGLRFDGNIPADILQMEPGMQPHARTVILVPKSNRDGSNFGILVSDPINELFIRRAAFAPDNIHNADRYIDPTGELRFQGNVPADILSMEPGINPENRDMNFITPVNPYGPFFRGSGKVKPIIQSLPRVFRAPSKHFHPIITSLPRP